MSISALVGMVGAWAGEWATLKVADALLQGVDCQLKPGDLEKALKIAANEAQSLEPELFFSCPPDGKGGVGKCLGEFFKGAAREELQKPLKSQGLPDVNFLIATFQQTLEDFRTIRENLNNDKLESWMRSFSHAYCKETNHYIRLQVAKEDYLKQLIGRFQEIKFAGIPVEGQESDRKATLLKIFVMPNVEEDKQSTKALLDADLREPSSGGGRQEQLMREQRLRMQQERTGRRFSANQLLRQTTRKRLVILGAPGSGKTTLLSYFAVVAAKRALGEVNEQIDQAYANLGLDSASEWLPILIPIRELELERHRDKSILEYAKHFAEVSLSTRPLPLDFFEYWLDEGRALILLDGLDEADEKRRHKVVERINSFLDQFDHNPAIITSRPAGYSRTFFNTDACPHYELLSFNDNQINEFIEHWYDSRINDFEKAKRDKQSLHKAFNGNKRIKLLARNPLLLTIIVLIHRYQQRTLPKQRYELYDTAVKTLLTSWDDQKELTDRKVLMYLELDDLRRLLEQLAFWIHNQGSTGDEESGTLIDRDELLYQLSQIIRKKKDLELYQAREEAERFIGFIRERTGLLNEQGQDCYAFVHKTFQEYLCAQEVIYQADNEDDFEIILNHINSHLHDSHWREVLLLLISQQKPKKAVKAIQAILEYKSDYEQWLHRDLFFAAECLTENIKDLAVTDFSLSTRIISKLIDLEIDYSTGFIHGVKNLAFETLCKLGETEFQTQALKLLQGIEDQIESVRFQKYRYALGEQESAVEKLIYLSKDDTFDTRSEATVALGELGDASEKIASLLVSLLQDDNSDLYFSAVWALGKLGNSSENVITILLSFLNDDDTDLCYFAAESLVNLGYTSEEVVRALILILQLDEPDTSDYANETLVKIGNSSELVNSVLLSMLYDDNSGERYSAAWALGRLGIASEQAVIALISCLKDKDSNVRSSVAEALGRLSNTSEQVVIALISCLKDEDSDVRYSAAEALGELGIASEQVITALVSRLEDESSSVRYNAAWALGRLGNTSEQVVIALISCLKDEDSDVRYSAAEALGELGIASEQVITALVSVILLQEDGNRNRAFRGAVKALGRLGNASGPVITVLLSLLQDKNSNVRCSAAEALGELGNASEEVAAALVSLLQDEDFDLRYSAAKGLRMLGNASEEVITALVSLLQHHNTCSKAVEALIELDNPPEEVITALVSLLQNQFYTDSVVANALERLAKKSKRVISNLVGWIEQHQDSRYVSNGINILWEISRS